jgi:hypothetical protein
MPNFLRSSYSDIFSSESEQVKKITDEFQRAFEADQRNRDRSYENWKAYFAVDGGQWKDIVRERLNQNNRHAAQYNIIGPKVDALTGSLIQESFDLDWKPIEGVRNSLTEAVKTSYYADSEIGNFEKAVEAVIRDGLIYEGNIKLVMNSKHNPLRNIDFVRGIPGYLVKDPYWISDDDDDLMKSWEVFHLHPEEIVQKFNVSSQRLDEMIRILKQSGNSYEQFSRDPNQLVQENLVGSLIRVIEYHWMEVRNTSRLIGQKVDSERWMPFPITEDKQALQKYMETNQIDPMSLIESPYEDRIHHVTTIAPEAVEHNFLEDGISKIQCGRLPYISFTSNRAFGQNKGIVDDLMDIQSTINKRESKLTDMISTAQGGGKLVNKNLFDGPVERQRFREKANDPSYVEFVEGEELSKERAIHYINSNQYPSQIINQLERMWDIVDRVSKVPAALEAISENSNESGVLFERKIAVARVNTITIMNRIRDFRKKMAECYFNQFQVAYNGPEREFTTIDGKRNVVLNRRVFNPKDGKIYVENRPDQVPRCHVIATESKSAPNKMIRDRAIFSELYNLSTQTNPEYASFFFELMLETMDLDENHKQRLSEISAIQKVRDKQRLRTEIDSLLSQSKIANFQGAEADMGLQQILGQLQGQEPEQIPQEAIPEEDVPEEPMQDESTLPSPQEEQAPPLSSDQA